MKRACSACYAEFRAGTRDSDARQPPVCDFWPSESWLCWEHLEREVGWHAERQALGEVEAFDGSTFRRAHA